MVSISVLLFIFMVTLGLVITTISLKEWIGASSILLRDDDIFRNGYSLMDDCWLHCWNASDYMGKGVDNKMNRIFAILEDKLK